MYGCVYGVAGRVRVGHSVCAYDWVAPSLGQPEADTICQEALFRKRCITLQMQN